MTWELNAGILSIDPSGVGLLREKCMWVKSISDSVLWVEEDARNLQCLLIWGLSRASSHICFFRKLVAWQFPPRLLLVIQMQSPSMIFFPLCLAWCQTSKLLLSDLLTSRWEKLVVTRLQRLLGKCLPLEKVTFEDVSIINIYSLLRLVVSI